MPVPSDAGHHRWAVLSPLGLEAGSHRQCWHGASPAPLPHLGEAAPLQGWSCTVVVSRKVRGRSLGPGYISGVAKVSSTDPNYCTQHLIRALSFPSERSYLGTSLASALFGGICLAMAGMRYSGEHVISRLEQKWLSPLTSPARQDAKQASRMAEELLARGTYPSLAL